MRFLFLFAGLLACSGVFAQKYFTKTGLTEFKASVDTFEPVEATNESTTAILNVETGEVAALILVKAFQFRVALMQEHFNENYMDSDEHPKATFAGTIKDFDLSKIGTTAVELPIEGTLTVKGKEKPVSTVGTFHEKDGKIMVDATFSVKPGDFDIEIPSVVRKKIAENVNITLSYELIEKK